MEDTKEKDLSLAKKKKTITTIFITISAVIFLSIAGLTYVLITNLPTDDVTDVTKQQEQQIQDTESEKEVIEMTDISQYTDIQLKNHEQMSISVSQTDDERGILAGIVSFRRKLLENDIENMRVINLMSLTRTDILHHFSPAKEDIQNSNLQAQWHRIGKPSVLATSPSPPVFDIITEITEINYPNTEHTFALLALSHGQEFAQANDSSPNYQIIIFAIKDENIIRLESNRMNLITDLGLSLQESEECSELDHLFESILTYNVECLKEVFETGVYNDQIQQQSEELMETFALRE